MKPGKYKCLHDPEVEVEVVGDVLVWSTVTSSEPWVLYRDLRPRKGHKLSAKRPLEFKRLFSLVK